MVLHQVGQWSRSSVILLIREAFRSGSIAAIVMMPFGLLFLALGLRINEYGMRVIQTWFGDLPRGVRVGLFALEHFVISWSVAIPLLILLLIASGRVSHVLVGAVYGGAFYVVVNSIALPAFFGYPTPWALGFTEVMLPSLLVHLVYGLSIAMTSRRFVQSAPAHRHAA